MPQPSCFLKRAGLQAVGDRLEEALEDREGELGAGLAISGGAHRHFGQVAQVRAGGIPIEHLDEKELDGEDRVEAAISLRLADPVTGR
jgi:hypothetical protein